MNLKYIFASLFVSFLSFSSCASATQVYDPQTKSFSSLEDSIKTLPPEGLFILGETHYVKDIQDAQGLFIEQFVLTHGLQSNFQVAWEFLEYPRQQILDESFYQYTQDQLTDEDLLHKVLGREPGQHLLYSPLFQVAKKFDGNMVATNAPREWKSVIVKDGISKLDPSKVPAIMERGPEPYFERFIEAMGGHGDAKTFESYFMAQSYTDAVMAESIIKNHNANTTFMVVGHFHSDYGHGLPYYLNKLTNEPIKVIHIVNFDGLSEEERKKELLPHVKYGNRADLILVLNP